MIQFKECAILISAQMLDFPSSVKPLPSFTAWGHDAVMHKK